MLPESETCDVPHWFSQEQYEKSEREWRSKLWNKEAELRSLKQKIAGAKDALDGVDRPSGYSSLASLQKSSFERALCGDYGKTTGDPFTWLFGG